MILLASVEDNAETAKRLKLFIEKYADEKSVDLKFMHYTSADELLRHMDQPYDLILMDIQLPGKDGMTAAYELRKLGYDIPLIFITSLAQYAVNGYDVDALDFMVKPVTYYQFAMKMDKACRMISRNHNVSFTISVDRSLRLINSRNLLYVETARHDLIFHTTENTYQTRGSLASVESQLATVHFLRINVCYLINMKFVTGLSSGSIRMENGDELIISRARKKEVLTTLAQFLGGSI